MVAGCYLRMLPLRPLWHVLRAVFGLSLLFYGQEFPTLAFHIVVFRLSGWKKVGGGARSSSVARCWSRRRSLASDADWLRLMPSGLSCCPPCLSQLPLRGHPRHHVVIVVVVAAAVASERVVSSCWTVSMLARLRTRLP